MVLWIWVYGFLLAYLQRTTADINKLLQNILHKLLSYIFLTIYIMKLCNNLMFSYTIREGTIPLNKGQKDRQWYRYCQSTNSTGHSSIGEEDAIKSDWNRGKRHKLSLNLTPLKLVLQSRWGRVHNKLLQKGSPLSVSGGSLLPYTPARFEMPSARGKTSLNARDWWKRKGIVYLKITQT